MAKEDISDDVADSNVALESGGPNKSKLADPNVVDWDGPDDALNPLNWPSRKRWAHVVMVALLALVTYV